MSRREDFETFTARSQHHHCKELYLGGNPVTGTPGILHPSICPFIQGGVGGPGEYAFLFNLPTDPDGDALHFQLQVSALADFSTTIIDQDSRAAEDGVANCKIFDGTVWVAYPEAGAGAGYYGKRVAFLFTSSVLERGKIYYSRFRVHDGTSFSDWTGEVRSW
jgi:hypothetical protein